MVTDETRGILDAPDRWIIEWSGSSLSRKRVILHNRLTGQRAVGDDWNDWDLALERALAIVECQGDLVTEVEGYLRTR